MSGNRFYSLSVVTLALLLFGSWTALAAAGDPSRGEALFVGSKSFANGGAPCLACHSLTGVGLSAGASYGPDLSNLYEDFGAEGVAGVLESLEFPGMAAIYASRPLSETEQSDLVAYLEKASKLSETPSSGTLAMQVIVGVGVLLVATFLLGLRRMKEARGPLIDRQRNIMRKGGLR